EQMKIMLYEVRQQILIDLTKKYKKKNPHNQWNGNQKNYTNFDAHTRDFITTMHYKLEVGIFFPDLAVHEELCKEILVFYLHDGFLVIFSSIAVSMRSYDLKCADKQDFAATRNKMIAILVKGMVTIWDVATNDLLIKFNLPLYFIPFFRKVFHNVNIDNNSDT
ncbi:hypothetical protein ACJX0J_014295, partial [Zea mays]